MTMPSDAVVKLYVFDDAVVVSEELVARVASRFEAEAATSVLDMAILIVIS